jgi:peptidoglycan/xylan/chitin deacetylase (PgdA/CDA1 family)
MAWAVRGRSSSVFGPSVYRGVSGRKAIALTFDDGPSASTPRILDILASYGAPATFFQCGENVRRAPELSSGVRNAGHEIGNHSYSHPNFAFQSSTFIKAEFARAQETIAQQTITRDTIARDTIGVPPVLMRAPYGVRWFGFREMQKELGLLGVMWTVIGRDWELSAPAIARRVISRARDGFIVCLHDGRGTLANPDARATIEAVRIIVPSLLEIGYHFETVSQILCPTIN